MKKSITRNYLYNLTYQILVMIIPLITTPYLSRVLGAENIGIYSFTISIVTYFILFGSLGVSVYGQREIAYVQEDKRNRSIIFKEIFLMRVITLSISMILFYYAFCLKGEYSIYYKILLLEILANMFDISWFFQGLEDFKKTVLRNAFVKILSVIAIFVFVRSESDLNKYLIIYVLSTILGNLTLWLYLPKYIVRTKISELNILKHIKPVFGLFIPQIATQLYTVLDKSMLGFIINNKSEVGYYEQAQKIVKLLLTVATSFGTVMVPRIANTYASGDYNAIKKYMNKSFSFILMLAFPLMFGIISIASHFVPFFYGQGYDKVVNLIIIMSPIIIAIGLSNVIGTQYLLPTKQQSKYTLSVVVGAIINVILNSILINNFASIGASIATVIAEIGVTIAQFILVRDIAKIKDVLKISYKYFFASILMFIISIIIGKIIANDVLSIMIQVIISSITYFIILIIWKDEMIINYIYKIKEKIIK